MPSKYLIGDIYPQGFSPLTTVGDIYIRGTLGDTRLPVGANEQVLSIVSDYPTWVNKTSPVYIGDAPPSSPYPGLLWWDSATGGFYIYYDDGTTSAWMGLTPVKGSTISGGISIVIVAGTLLDGNETQIIKLAGTFIVAPTSAQKYTIVFAGTVGTCNIVDMAATLITSILPSSSKDLIYDGTDWYVLN